MLPKGIFPTSSDIIHSKAGKLKYLEDAVSLLVVLLMAGTVLFHKFGLKLEWELNIPQNDFPILIWGGMTSIGQSSIQLAKRLHGQTKIIVVA